MATQFEQQAFEIAEDFGQSVDLTGRIREILANYPEGTTVFKEIVQNADDAGATKVCFCMDRRRHGVDTLLFKESSSWQGPALLAYNNAQFSAQDFESISKLGGSKKQGEPWKTGRFGVGFNSSYHLSDLPSFVSGRHIVFFDPHCKFLPNISTVNPGKRIDFVTSVALRLYRDQFLPYCVFGCDMERAYSGTVFRFPLRTASQAAVSELSKQCYSAEEVIRLLHELHLEASMIMLFLKNVEIIDIYDWQPGADNPCLLYSCFLKSPSNQVHFYRHALPRLSRAWASVWANGSSVPKQIDSFQLDFVTKRYSGTEDVEIKIESFIVVQCLEASTSRIGITSSTVAKEHGVHLLPWAAVAANISDITGKGDHQSNNDGSAFCFLPLPVKTNLPVHINGYFELSLNRRDIWYGNDMEGMGKIRSDWNVLLLTDVLASAYCHLLFVARELNCQQYSLWPCGTYVEPWKSMVVQLYKYVVDVPLLHSDLDGGKWITPFQAVFHDEDFPNAEGLASALILTGLPVVRLPKAVVEMLSSHCACRMVCPTLLREHLRMSSIRETITDRELGLIMLDYCLGDVIDEEAAISLSGLQLIPLSSGKFGVFGNRNERLSYFVCSDTEYFLLEKAKERLIDRRIPKSVLLRLSHIAEVSNSNILLLSSSDFPELLTQILPVEWMNKDELEWRPSAMQNHPSEIWMARLWVYLKDSCTDLSIFDVWPILPTINGCICKASKRLGILRGGVLEGHLETILINLGCRILRPDLEIDYSYVSSCVYPPSGPGILDAILSIASEKGCSFEKLFLNVKGDQRRELRAFLLEPKWYTENQMNGKHVHVLKSLPLFETYEHSNCREQNFVDIRNEKRFLPPSNVDEIFLGPEFIRVQSQREFAAMTEALGVEQMARITFFRFRILSQIDGLSSDVRNHAMLTILRELPLLSVQDPSIKDTLMHLAFVPTWTGKLQPPRSLYDPRIEELQLLLNEKESFPSDEFKQEEILDVLQRLGLQTVVSPDAVLQSAYQVESLMKDKPEEAHARGQFLLSYLELNAQRLLPVPGSDGINKVLSKVSDIFQNPRIDSSSSKKFWNELVSVCWCPVLVQPPHQGLPWPMVSTALAPPRLVRLPSDLWLASASMRILDGECRSAFLCQRLGWADSLGANVVAAQLMEFGKNHDDVDSQGLRQALATVIPKMYSLLTERVGTHEVEIVKVLLEGSRWVWVGDRFVTVEEVVLNGPLHLAPYLWAIPADVAVFKELLLELGVKESLNTKDFVIVLSKMATMKNGLPLNSHELKAVVWVAQHLTDSHFDGQITTLFLPDANGILLPSSELVYNDAPWIPADEAWIKSGSLPVTATVSNNSAPRFVHANISNDLAEKLGMNSVRSLLLAESSDSVNVTLHGVAEAFGQHEALTTRLKHIVEMYADGPGILCELLQNSDDAGASEVSFLLDKSHFPSSSLLSPRMSDWQGPALYCFNNSIFTSEDLHAISRIGQDSKLEKPHTVGRFGLGFNSVYHFTDVPGFVSGDNLVIFDPHASHLPGISPSHPGLKINFVGRGIAHQFPDQCRPFMLFGCDLQKSYQGTLFRFPLRNTVTAAHSLIKQDAYSAEMVLSLFANFQAIASEVLLFLHKVSQITVYVREGMDQELHVLYRVERHPTLVKSVYDFVRGHQAKKTGKDHFYSILQKTPVEILPFDCQKIKITIHEVQKQYTQLWILSDCLGGKQAREMATSRDNKVHGFVPWAGIAAKLAEFGETNINESMNERMQDFSALEHVSLEGRAFCFLPLPVKTGLPVHVNAYFELSSNRRDIWYGDDMAGGGKLRSDWNRCLLQDVASPAYVRLLANAASDLGPSGAYFSLWPTGSPSMPWLSLLRGVYLSAVELGLPMLHTKAKGGHWISVRKAVFPDTSYSDATELGHALAEAGLPLVNVPESVVCKFQEFCPSLRYLTPKMLRSALIRHKRSLQSRMAMLAALKYCLHDIESGAIVEKLQGLPLIPLATGRFGTFTDSKAEETFFVANETDYSLLKDTLLDRLVDRSIDSLLMKKLVSIAASESMNVVLLTPSLLKDLLPKILPVDWHGRESVYWTPGHSGHPSEGWMELFWSFLCESVANLSLFLEWPLLPTSDGHLLQLRKNSNVLKDDRWSENMISVIQKADCFLLSTKFTFKHPILEDYVHDATACGLLEALLGAAGGYISLPNLLNRVSEQEIQELRGYLLQNKWFSSGQMSAVHLQVFKFLPIFRSYGSSMYVNLSDCMRFFPPDGVDVELLGDSFIHAESAKEEIILSDFLGIVKIRKQEFYEQHVFKRMENDSLPVLGRVLPNLLRGFSSLEGEIPSIRSFLAQLPLIPTTQGNLKTPGKLYDPRVSELYLLLDRDAFFPAEEFSEPTILDVLVQLGLKRTLGLRGVLDSAISIATLSVIDEQRAFEMGKCLLAYISSLDSTVDDGYNCNLTKNIASNHSEIAVNPSPIESPDLDRFGANNMTNGKTDGSTFDTSCKNDEECCGQFWIDLTHISWCPVSVDAPLPELPWPKGLNTLLAPPKIARPKSQMWHVSASMRILEDDFDSIEMMSRLGWLEKPNFSIMAMQLIELSKHHCEMQVECSSGSAPADGAEKCEGFNTILDKVIPSLYSSMEESLNTENLLSLQSMLEGTRCVWVGDSFVYPKETAFEAPFHYRPYLHIVPSNLSCYKGILTALGVRDTFDIIDFVSVLQRISADMNGGALSKELVQFVVRVLEAIGDFMFEGNSIPGKSILDAVLIPDTNGILTSAKDLVYDDAPWLEKRMPGFGEMQRFVHTSVKNELAIQLGAKSLRYLSLVDKEMTKELPCLPLDDISRVLEIYGDEKHLLFDLLEVADRFKAQKLHVIYDKRMHSQTSILQPNLGQFQGPALTVVFEGAELTTEEVCNLQMSPSWRIRGQNNNYGGGLLSCYNITDLLLLVSNGYLYLFDPSGSILASSLTYTKKPLSGSPQGKMYTLQGTDIPQKFSDQFQPLVINQQLSWAKPNITILRMPLRKKLFTAIKEPNHSIQATDQVPECLFQNLIKHASMVLLFLNSVEAVHLSTWEADELYLHEHFSVKVDPACALLRNPFLGKNWRKFQLSTIFGSSSNVTKMHSIDVLINQNGNCVRDKWLIALSFGCGQTQSMALDRKYLSYNLSPVAGIAAHVSRNGSLPVSPPKSSILCPLPLSFSSKLPVVIIGCFIVCHNGMRCLFSNSSGKEITPKSTDTSGSQLVSLHPHLLWNQELMTCVREAYTQFLAGSLNLRQDFSAKTSNSVSVQVSRDTWKMLAAQSYSLWPLSQNLVPGSLDVLPAPNLKAYERHWLVKLLVRPMYVGLADLRLWQQHGGVLVKATEGLFLSNPKAEKGSNLPPGAICEFLKEHYKVFAVPSELTKELEEAGVGIKIITPKMVRSLLCKITAFPKGLSIKRFVELLEYCCADIDNVSRDFQHRGFGSDENFCATRQMNKMSNLSVQIGDPEDELASLRNSSSGELKDAGGDALDIMANFGRALMHFGKGVVEDLSTDAALKNKLQRRSLLSSDSSSSATTYEMWLTELKGLPCPTATASIVRLGMTELWVGNIEQQQLMLPLAAKFINIACLERPLLLKLFKEHMFQQTLQVKPFTVQLLSSNLTFVLPKGWIERISSNPWVAWDYVSENKSESPSPEWLRLFWKNVNLSPDELSFFMQCPLVPAVIDSTLLIKVQNLDLVFIPPQLAECENYVSTSEELNDGSEGALYHNENEHNVTEYCRKAFIDTRAKYSWVFAFLQHCHVPVFDENFLDCKVVESCLPGKGQSFGKVIRSKLLAAQQAGHLTASDISLVPSDCDALFSLFATEFQSSPSVASACSSADFVLLRSLPIYKTTTGAYTAIDPSTHCVVSPTSFFQPQSDLCLQHLLPEIGGLYYGALGIRELSDNEVLLKFCLPGFDTRSKQDQDNILAYLHLNWDSLQHDDAVVATLADTQFVSNGDSRHERLFQPKELLDPKVLVFRQVYRDKQIRFPDKRFTSDKWLEILRRAGLRYTMDADILLECAKEVEDLGKKKFKAVDGSDLSFSDGEVPEDVYAIGSAVVEAILGNFASVYGSSFCEPLSHIAFVPVERGLPIMNGNGGKKVFASYKDLVLMKDWPLAWTFSPILTRASLVPPEFSWHSLQLQSPPRFQTVLRHLQMVGKHDGEEIMSRWPAGHGGMTVEDAFLEILKYLDKIWGNLSALDKKLLEEVHFIPVANGTRLCPANRLFVRLDMNLAPFVFQLPSSYLPFVKLLSELGMQESPTFNSMRDLLLQMHHAHGYQRLNPNEIRAILQVLNFICECDVKNNDSHDLASGAIVPDDAGRLVHAKACVYVDPFGSAMVKKIDTSRLRFTHPHLSEHHCICLGIRKLSEVVVEVLDDNFPLEYTDYISGVSINNVVKKLQSRTFHHAMWTLVQEFAQEVPSLKHWTEVEVERTLLFAAKNLHCVKVLHTQFVMLPGNVDITRKKLNDSNIAESSHFTEDLRHRVYEYVDKPNAKVLLAEPPDFVSFSDILAVVVSRLLDSPICLPISSLLNVPLGSEGLILEIMRMKLHQQENLRSSGKSEHSIIPGNELLAYDSTQVQVHPLRPYYAGEIVAWCSDLAQDTKLRYGLVVEDVRASAGQALYYLQVETGPGDVQTLLSSNVFSFKSTTLEMERNFGSPPHQVSKLTSQSECNSSQVSVKSTTSTTTQSLEGIRKGFSKEIEAGTVVHAIKDMMGAVGFSLDLDQQSLLKQAFMLQKSLTAAHAALSFEQERANVALKEAEVARAAWLCRICLSLEVNSLLVPCGHVMCQNCCAAVTRCPFCRQGVSKAVHLYRP